ncbi:hypothetical protein I79_026003 [Cricetulus griseus]|uniref:Uncharacterized protein n=1 Tax=Cricetulus griseus TaxID=10029 RepID=G3IPS6_CRIGR|nr:hypothetical protein I79_026003 [Cricetulus griseus]
MVLKMAQGMRTPLEDPHSNLSTNDGTSYLPGKTAYMISLLPRAVDIQYMRQTFTQIHSQELE